LGFKVQVFENYSVIINVNDKICKNGDVMHMRITFSSSCCYRLVISQTTGMAA